MCSLFGIIDYKNSLPAFARRTILRVLSQECEVRGTDATGIAYVSNDGMHVYKRPVAASKFKFNLPRESHMVIGHTRMTTKGSQDINCNNHPFYGRVPSGKFALAHNGVLNNDEYLRRTMDLPNTSIETDSYIAVQLLEHYGEISLESIAKMAETVSGSFCFSILTDTTHNWELLSFLFHFILKFYRFYLSIFFSFLMKNCIAIMTAENSSVSPLIFHLFSDILNIQAQQSVFT